MDSNIKARNKKADQFLYNLILYSLAAFLSSLFYSYLFLFPSMNHLFFVYILDIYFFFQSPNFLFLLGNVIIVILVGESKLSGSMRSSPATEIYDEYVQRSRGDLRGRSRSVVNVEHCNKKDQSVVGMNMNKKINNISTTTSDRINMYAEEKKEEMLTGNLFYIEDVHDHKYHDHDHHQDQEADHEKLDNLHREELNRRVEEYIARVNRQRMLEATE